MPTRKIADPPKGFKKLWERIERGPCNHPEHNPPMHMVYEPGTWEHTCPGCQESTVFHVGGIQ